MLYGCVCSHPGTGKYFTISSHSSGLVMQVDGELIEAGSKVVMAEKVMSKVKGSSVGSVALRQQFCCDEMTGTIRSALRFYCLDIDESKCAEIVSFHGNCVVSLTD